MTKHLPGSICHWWGCMSVVLVPWQLYWLYLHCLACAQRQRRVCHLWGGRSTWSDLKVESARAPPEHNLAGYYSQHPSLHPGGIISLSHCQKHKNISMFFNVQVFLMLLCLESWWQMTSDNTVPFTYNYLTTNVTYLKSLLQILVSRTTLKQNDCAFKQV